MTMNCKVTEAEKKKKKMSVVVLTTAEIGEHLVVLTKPLRVK